MSAQPSDFAASHATLRRAQLRRMSAGDLDQVLAIEARTYAYPWTPGNFSDALNANYDCWVLTAEGVIIGYAIVLDAAGEAHLLNLTIAPERQRGGLGSALLRHLLAQARSAKQHALLLEVRPSNPGALRLYAAFGFDQVGVRRDYYPAIGRREDALLLTLKL